MSVDYFFGAMNVSLRRCCNRNNWWQIRSRKVATFGTIWLSKSGPVGHSV